MALSRLLDRSGVFEAGNLNGLQQRLLANLIRRENDLRVAEEEERYKAQILLHRPDIYDGLFGAVETDIEEVEQIVPETEGDVEELMRQMREAGAI